MKALDIKNLRKTYANGFEALKGISFNVDKGDFFALLGPNGAGKSTTIGIITSLVNKTSGTVSAFGYDLDNNPNHVKACIGVVPQEFNFNIFLTPYDILVNQAGFYGIMPKIAKQRAEKYLKQLELWDKRKDVVRNLSGGQKRRLMIARALIHEPKLLILDEPTAGVDIEIRRSMWEFMREINEAGTTIILTTHYLEEAENLCKHIAIINHGELIEHASMASILRKLHVETFIFYLQKSVDALPQIENFALRQVDACTIEADLRKGQVLTDLMSQLQQQNIIISSMRNKANRLEELFLAMTQENSNPM